MTEELQAAADRLRQIARMIDHDAQSVAREAMPFVEFWEKAGEIPISAREMACFFCGAQAIAKFSREQPLLCGRRVHPKTWYVCAAHWMHLANERLGGITLPGAGT